MPSHVALPHVMYNVVKLPGQTAGFLGSAFEPLQVTKDPNAPDFRVGEIELPAGLTLRVGEPPGACLAASMLKWTHALGNGGPGRMNAITIAAFKVLPRDARGAASTSRETAAIRDRVRPQSSRPERAAGPAAGRGRRAVRQRLRQGHNGLDNWDTHVNNFARLKDTCCRRPTGPSRPWSRTWTRAACWTRRWSSCWANSAARRASTARGPRPLAGLLQRGAGRRRREGGAVYGASDKIGAYPDLNPVSPGDLAATIFWRFGLDPLTELHDVNGRPFSSPPANRSTSCSL